MINKLIFAAAILSILPIWRIGRVTGNWYQLYMHQNYKHIPVEEAYKRANVYYQRI